jgi:hypothetical protein
MARHRPGHFLFGAVLVCQLLHPTSRVILPGKPYNLLARIFAEPLTDFSA